jgi:MFS family permease
VPVVDAPPPTAAPHRLQPREWATLLVLCGAIFLEGIDVAMLNVALPSIREDLGLSTGVLSAVVSGYVLGYGGFMLLGGAAADRFGRRRMFILWLGVFVVFSGLGGLATSGWMLLTARFVTGVAAAFMTPAGLSLVTTTFEEGPRRNKALVVYGATGGAGFSLGLVAGGLLTEISWRWVFFAPVLLAGAVLAIASRVLVRDRPARDGGPFDVSGSLTLTAGAVLVVYAITRLEHPGDGVWITAGAAAAGVILLVTFVAVERRTTTPLVRLGLLRSGPLARANAGALAFAAAFFGFQFLVSLYLQELLGWSSLETGLARLLRAIDVVVAPTLTPRLVARFGNATVISAGVVAALGGYALFGRATLDWTYLALLPTVLLIGVAFSLAYGPLTISATDGVADAEQGVAGGLVNTSFQFGAAIGVSAASAVSTIALDGPGAGDALDAVRTAAVVPVVAALIGVAVALSGVRRRQQRCPDVTEAWAS